ncbi:LLM class flavin-dependent oxidoreductase [Antarcticimicrobium sediminis]|uniref:LLM class flavin-dependent oxidoreductase n=1 Tax=Antarcticimicrobium sediminis TaxID=2546227 RepID=A0A4R5EZC5_9RHOB|nr:LLM class flavin-dependent oxidoreductase [Antarcticimicrobium sediminis]
MPDGWISARSARRSRNSFALAAAAKPATGRLHILTGCVCGVFHPAAAATSV